VTPSVPYWEHVDDVGVLSKRGLHLLIMKSLFPVLPVFNYAPSHDLYWGSAGIAARILNLGTIWRLSGQVYVPAALPPGQEPRVPIA
jgi:hypothetical protein